MNQCMPKLTKTSTASKTHISWDFSLARLNYTLSSKWIAWACHLCGQKNLWPLML